MKLTQRAFLLGAVALCFYLVAVVNALPSFYYVLVWLAVGLLAASLGIALLSLTGTTCVLSERRTCGYGRGEVEVNKAPPLWDAAFGNTGSLNKTGLELELRLQRQDETARSKGKSAPVLARFLVEALPAGTKLNAPLSLDFLPRGVYSLQSARLVGSDVLGLFRASKRLSVSLPLEIVVAPPVLPMAARREFARGGGGRDGSRAMSRLGTGEDLRGVRPYVPGDDWRHVHWATTARTGELAVREFERNGRDAALVVWDGVLSATPVRKSLSSLEEELCLVTSLLVALDARRMPAQVALWGREEEKLDANGDDGLLSRSALKGLARAAPERTRPLSLIFAQAGSANDSGLSQVFFVSSSLQGDLVDCVSACAGRGQMPIVALCEMAPSHTPQRAPKQGRTSGKQVPTSIEIQEQALRATGARVVRVSLTQGEPSLSLLDRALFDLLEPI